MHGGYEKDRRRRTVVGWTARLGLSWTAMTALEILSVRVKIVRLETLSQGGRRESGTTDGWT